jgi:NAD(P)-dependent dehydrogenase (short-subunit alcohol dehydrogenase family)
MPQPPQQQTPPGTTAEMTPQPDHGEQSYEGSGKLTDKRAVITGADSGIGKAVAIAFAREGADVLVSYLNEADDAADTADWVQQAGRKAVMVRGDLSSPQHCREVIDTAVQEMGGIDILVSNAAFQMSHETIEEIPDEEWDFTIATNLSAFFHLTKASLPHMKAGASIIATTSINYQQPSPQLLPYAATKAGMANMVASLAQGLADRGIRANGVAPGPIWTPLIPSTMPEEAVESFGEQAPLQRPGQPAELAPIYVMLASDEVSYVSGAIVPATGGRPML